MSDGAALTRRASHKARKIQRYLHHQEPKEADPPRGGSL